MRAQTYGTSTREPYLANTESASLIHSYFISIHSQASANTSYTQDVIEDFHRVCCAMIRNNLMSLPESSSPLDYPILTPSVSFLYLYDLYSFIGNFNFNRHRSCKHHEIQCLPHTQNRQNNRPKLPKLCQRTWELNSSISLYF